MTILIEMAKATYSNDGDECVADVDASGNPLRTYVWGSGIDNLLAMSVFSDSETNTYYAVKDHLGSVHALVDEQGQIAAQDRGCIGQYGSIDLPLAHLSCCYIQSDSI